MYRQECSVSLVGLWFTWTHGERDVSEILLRIDCVHLCPLPYFFPYSFLQRWNHHRHISISCPADINASWNLKLEYFWSNVDVLAFNVFHASLRFISFLFGVTPAWPKRAAIVFHKTVRVLFVHCLASAALSRPSRTVLTVYLLVLNCPGQDIV